MENIRANPRNDPRGIVKCVPFCSNDTKKFRRCFCLVLISSLEVFRLVAQRGRITVSLVRPSLPHVFYHHHNHQCVTYSSTTSFHKSGWKSVCEWGVRTRILLTRFQQTDGSDFTGLSVVMMVVMFVFVHSILVDEDESAETMLSKSH